MLSTVPPARPPPNTCRAQIKGSPLCVLSGHPSGRAGTNSEVNGNLETVVILGYRKGVHPSISLPRVSSSKEGTCGLGFTE